MAHYLGRLRITGGGCMLRKSCMVGLALAALAAPLGCGDWDWPEDREERWAWCQAFIRRWELDQDCGDYLTFDAELAQSLEDEAANSRLLGAPPPSRVEVERRVRADRERRGPGCAAVAKPWSEKQLRQLHACRVFMDAYRGGRLD